jgi:putative transposase
LDASLSNDTLLLMQEGPHFRKSCKRLDIPGYAHELTFSCFHNQPLLLHDRTRNHLANAIFSAKKIHGFHLWAWVFMPTHVHLLIWPTTQQYSIARILQSIKQPVGRLEITRAKKSDPEMLALMATGLPKTPYHIWQEGGGYDKLMNLTPEIRNLVDYIHANPVRKGLVSSPEEWLWSSARDWLDLGTGPLHIDKEFFPSM